ncbi:MAG: hypothetical protein HYR81_02860 [Nitrospirae bacterium]|nr:hypothetical protein [Nitrospirota bacterium]
MPRRGDNEEIQVKRYLETNLGMNFRRHVRIPIGDTYKNFDLVSTNNKIIVMVKSSILGNNRTKKSGYASTRKARLIEDLFYLEKIPGEKKILALTNRDLFTQFTNDMSGIGMGVEIIYVQVLPPTRAF